MSHSTRTAFPVLVALSFCHLLNDALQSLIPAIYPIIKETHLLTFGQIGLITFVFQLSSSILQPVVGFVTDRRPQPYSLPVGMCMSMVGIFLLAQASSFGLILVAVAFTGVGSAVFHPEASRLAYMASGGRHGMAQSLFQVGGNLGSSLGSLMAALVIVKYGQGHIAWFCLVALVAVGVMLRISRWYKANLHRLVARASVKALYSSVSFSKAKVSCTFGLLLMLLLSKYIYLSSLTSYYTFYLRDKFGLDIKTSQLFLFAFLFAVAAGTFLGGPVGDRIGRKYVIWISILGVAPFTLLLPYANLLWTGVLSVIIGLVLSSAFSAILVYAQELLPGKVGLISGLFFGFAFGTAGIAAAVIGNVADREGIGHVFAICSYLPLLGVVAVLLPNIRRVEG